MEKNKSFAEFVTKQSDGSEAVKFDPEKEVAEWREYLEQLYKMIEQYVSPYKDGDAIQLAFSPVSITEEALGPYVVNSCVLRVGNVKFIFTPIGTMLIGSKGRVDVLGPNGRGMLALVRGDGPRINVRVTINDGSKPAVSESPLKPEVEKEVGADEWKWKIVSNKPPYKYTEMTVDNFLDFLMGLAA